MSNVYLGGHRGMGCTDNDFYQSLRDIRNLPVENTLKSVQAAFTAGADYIETDAVMSADGVLFTLHNVVSKDHFFGSMPPALLNTMPFRDIQQFSAGRFENGRIDNLKSILSVAAAAAPGRSRWKINIEIKGVQGSGQPFETNEYLQKLAETVEDSEMPEADILFSSFCLQNIITMSQLMPSASYGMLFAEKPEARGIYTDRTQDHLFQYLPFTPAMIERVYETWQGQTDVALKYLHPEAMTVTPDALATAAYQGAGLNVWAIFEELTEARKEYYANLVRRCEEHNVPLTIITDYIAEMRDFLDRKGL